MEDLKITIIDRLQNFCNSLDNYDENQLNAINENLNVLLSQSDDKLSPNVTITFPLDIMKLDESTKLTRECIEALFLGYTIKKVLKNEDFC